MKLILIVLLSLMSVSQLESLKPKIEYYKEEAKITIYNDYTKLKFDKMPFSSFAKSVEYIKLETRNECLISIPKSVFFHKEDIIIYDLGRNEFFFFNKKGKYLRKISRKGRGPGEYQGITSCMFDPNSETFIIHSLRLNKLIRLTYDGDLINELNNLSPSSVIRDMINLPNGNFLCYTPDYLNIRGNSLYSGLWEIDSQGNFIKSYFTQDLNIPAKISLSSSYFQKLKDGSITLLDVIFNDVYIHRNNSLKRWISINNPQSTIRKIVEERDDIQKLKYKNISCNSIQIKGNYFFSFWRSKDSKPLVLTSKVDDMKKYKFSYHEDFNDDNIPAIMGYPISNNTDNILTFFFNSTFFLNEFQEKEISNTTRTRLSQEIKGVYIENMNPILELIYIKA